MMIDDIATCHELGVHGVVIGALTADGDIDFEACKRMVEVAGNMNITFHRAFDLCKDPIKSIDQIIELGCNRLLTSGQAASAEAGVELLHKLVEYANGRIVILAGGGVTPTNAAKILQQSGTNEIHASARSTVQSNMKYRLDGVSMGAADVDEYSRKTTDVKIVTQIKRAIS
jgi:copper homeostasis protein